jgi:tRNA(Arg) A34 adenosine deaminase TadA
MIERDDTHLRRAIALAHQARENGNHPFGALLADGRGEVVLEAENTVLTEHDCTNHAELNLVRAASRRFAEGQLGDCTLFTSTEPCAMCAGAIYWSGIGRVVFALSGAALTVMVAGDGGQRPSPRGGRAGSSRGLLGLRLGHFGRNSLVEACGRISRDLRV